MRTTVTLEPDVEALLQARMRERGLSFKEALNKAVRAGLARPNRKARPFKQKTFSMGREQNFRWEKALAMAAAMEDEEIVRKMSPDATQAAGASGHRRKHHVRRSSGGAGD